MVVSVLDFDVNIGDIKERTKKFQSVIDFCFENGGGEIIVPAGEYVLGGIRLRSNIVLRLQSGAKLIGSKNVEDYNIIYNDNIQAVPEEFLPENPYAKGRKIWYNAFILIYNEKNVSILGEEGSFIDGRNCYNPEGEEKYRGPHAITILKSEGIRLDGYTIINSANWAHNMWCCKNITCNNITIKGGHDGIDFFGSEDVELTNCHCYTGDDCVAGFDNKNVLIENCIFNSSCSAFRFCGTNILISNCEVFGPGEYPHRSSLSKEEKEQGLNADLEKLNNYRNNMLSFFTYYADMRLVFKNKPSNIVIKDCKIKNCDRFLHYNFSGSERWQSNMPLSDITFDNVKVDNTVLPLNLYGANNIKVTLKIKNSTINFNEKTENKSLINAANFDEIILENVFTNLKADSIIFAWKNIGEIKIDGGNISQNFDKILEEPDFDFNQVSGIEI